MSLYLNVLIICFYLIFFSIDNAHSQETPNHSLGQHKPLEQYFLTFPPYWHEEENNSFSGLHYRLAKKLYEHAGLEVNFVHVPYQRMQFQVEQGNVAFINYGDVKGVNIEEVLHVCVPPTVITLRVYYLKDNLPEITSINGFEGKNVIIMHGLPLGKYNVMKDNDKINFMRPRTIESALKGLRAQRGDYFIVFDNLMLNSAQYLTKSEKESLKNYPLFSLNGYPITTPKVFKGGKALCAKVLESYQQLVKEGVIDKKHKILASDVPKQMALLSN
ncbi:substrate-binding periplasmic protein [Litorilituus lipolyticus]|uniref:Transporter substrate-binding domain-containing protein n=1 Tax=Litorilituus lipolyticus TaxID=2491017 RepID=A0A502L0X5_9GAMM|nr:transporter substrate-binding domain-containing protein [Litorilituus lipolyticus]TPH15583.1 transporter substrate-binding domain-containing protein [Litorilituus lipolyticus]